MTASTGTSDGKSRRRRYDKGERRYKHVGKGSKPYIEFDPGEPRKWVGKCPATLTAKDRQGLLDKAIPAPNGDREVDFPKKLYAVSSDGAIYEAQTSDWGRSYHGYPYHGKLSRTLVNALRAEAVLSGIVELFDQWVKTHIELHGA